MSTSPFPNPSRNLSPLVSISAPTKNMSLPPSTGNRSIAPSRMKQFVTPSNINVSAAQYKRVFPIALDRCAAPNDLKPRGAIGDRDEPQTVAVGEAVKTWTQVYVGDCIGRGSWGPVYHSLNLTTVQTVAVKSVRLVRLKERHITQMMEEIDLVKRLSHPSIVKYEGMARDEHTLKIVIEYAENDSLKEKLELSGKINETLAANYVVEILEGLDFLHSNGIVHGNLKAANIFTTNVGSVKLSDFGLSLNRLALGGEIRNIPCAPNWAAPEIIEQTGSSTKSDIWSLGCTVIELLTGQPPYGDIPNIQLVRFRIAVDDYPPIPEDFSRPLISFLEECFQRVPAHRPSVEELFEHEWLKHGTNKEMQTPDTNSIPDDMKSKQSKYDTGQLLTMVPNLVDTSTSKSVRPPRMSWHRISQFFSPFPAQRPRISGTIRAKPVPSSVGGHSFVDATFREPVICRGCMESMRKAAALCSRCCIVAHSKCMARVPAGCNTLRKYLM
ncbi:kinase-like domain-containing protein [Russula brevipes]|nr:kinase-like domain-containing protein [Russula brevipes]